ncbi:MAG: nucleotide sugar dehydrogenase [Clostridia bacterium]
MLNKKKICVLGLGYIGLPTAAMFATHGHEIIGIDVKEDIITALNNGKITINEPYLDIMVQAAVTSGNLIGRNEPTEADVFIIAVPTPITKDKKPDLSYVRAAAESIVPYLREGNVVILESTSPTGTVKDVIVPILSKSELILGEQLFVAYSPERVLPGKILIELVENNRIIGGINSKSSEIAKELYKTFVKGEIYVTDATTAEMCKMMENTFRDVNIALANELAILCENEGINAWEVIKLCNKHPRVNIHQPGPGVGGHCLAIDPWFIVDKYPDNSNLISLSRTINDSMPNHVLEKVEKVLNTVKGKKTIAILGITYKPNVDDIRESPIIHLINLLEQDGNYEIRVCDPYVKEHHLLKKDIISAVANSDLILLGVNHNEFSNLNFEILYKEMRNKNILDTRNSINKEQVEKIGFRYFLLGNR